MAVVVVAVLFVACGSDPPARTPAGARASCFADTDCVVTDFSGCCTCCLSPPHAIPKTEADRQTSRCASMDCKPCDDKLTCAKVPSSTEFEAKCKEGTCAAVHRE